MEPQQPLARVCQTCGASNKQSYAVRLEAYADGKEAVVYCTSCRTRIAAQRGMAGAFMFDGSGFMDWDDHIRGGMNGARDGDRQCEFCERPMVVDVVGERARWLCYDHPYASPA